MNYSDKIRNLRLQRGLTQMELADRLGTSQSSITSWENGRREPDFATFRKLADFFRVPMSALLPSSDEIDEDYVGALAESLHQNPRLKLLFDKSKYLSDKDLDAVISVVSAIQRERE